MMDATIAHFRILEMIGEGGMGEVYAAQDLRLNRTVALKRIRQDIADESARKRMWREARAAAAVNHPHVCQIYEVVEEGDELLIAMELLEGSSLQEHMSSGPLPTPEAKRIALEVLGALEAVHDCGLVHRDLKPANIILTRHGVKLLDFGLSRTPPSGDTEADLAITRSGQAVGTPRYMSPEQWIGAGISPTCDLFAMGAILFEMLTGTPAILGSTLREVAEDAIHGEPPLLPDESQFTGLDPVIQNPGRLVLQRTHG
jgi:serine/threonine protein kinase